jgi:hypothetical protein
MKVIVGDYSSKDKSSLLARCEQKRSEYDGLLHAGVIHYIQGKLGEDGFILKAAISRVLDACPSIWPEDLPEQLERAESPKITENMKREFGEMNKGLIIPIQGYEVAQIIKLGKKFLTEVEEREI